MGIMFSAFSWTYVAMQVPGGLFLDRFGSKITYYWSMTLWSLCTFLQASCRASRRCSLAGSASA